MPYLLELDSGSYILPEDENINSLLKTLKKAKRVRWDYGVREVRGKRFYRIDDDIPHTIQVSIIDKSQILEPKKPKQIAQKVSPDCNGEMFPEGD
jgi:hypothetical protein